MAEAAISCVREGEMDRSLRVSCIDQRTQREAHFASCGQRRLFIAFWTSKYQRQPLKTPNGNRAIKIDSVVDLFLKKCVPCGAPGIFLSIKSIPSFSAFLPLDRCSV